eukprot:jgi/Chrzof1/11645/Cz06g03150.t1
MARWDSASEAHARHAAGLAAAAAEGKSAEQHDEQPQVAAAIAPGATLGGSIINTAVGVVGCTALVAVAAAACGPALAYTSIEWLFWGSAKKTQAS